MLVMSDVCRYRSQNTKPPELPFRALLNEEASEVELALV